MAPGFLLNVALRNLRRRAVRSGLTTLGIVIGVAAVITAISIGNGAKAKVEGELSKLNPSQINVVAAAPASERGRSTSSHGLTLADYSAIRQQLRGIVTGSTFSYQSLDGVRAMGKAVQAQIIALQPDGFEMPPRTLVAGSYFGAADTRQASNVCVITLSMSIFLFGGRSPLAQYLHLRNVPFRIIGVVADDAAFKNADRPEVTDNEVFIPITSLLQRIERNASLVFSFKADSPLHVKSLQQQIRNLMETRRGNRKMSLTVEAASATIESYTESSRTLAWLLASIATISLLVGGIGIMNIMLVNVSERSHEIGILLAVGVRIRDVQRQFLAESAILSMAGGVVGVFVGIATALVMAHINDWPARVTMSSVVGALLCSVSVGLFFGYYPARQASRLDPIAAMRSV